MREQLIYNFFVFDDLWRILGYGADGLLDLNYRIMNRCTLYIDLILEFQPIRLFKKQFNNKNNS